MTFKEWKDSNFPGEDNVPPYDLWEKQQGIINNLTLSYNALKEINSNTEDSLNIHLAELHLMRESLDYRVMQNLRDEVYKLKDILKRIHNLNY